MEKPSKPHPRPRPEPEEDDEEYDEGGGGVQALIIILAVIVCLAGVGYFIWTNVLSGLTDPGTIYTVPNVIGYTLRPRPCPRWRTMGSPSWRAARLSVRTWNRALSWSRTPRRGTWSRPVVRSSLWISA